MIYDDDDEWNDDDVKMILQLINAIPLKVYTLVYILTVKIIYTS